MECKIVFSSLKSVLCGALIGAVCFVSPISANAGSVSNGASSAMSAYGHNYTAYNTSITGKLNNSKFARAYTNINAGENLPGGYMGVKPMLYYSDGSLWVAGDWDYSSSNSSGMGVGVSRSGFSGTPSIYSQGYARIWMGTGYWTYGTFIAPTLNDYTV